MRTTKWIFFVEIQLKLAKRFIRFRENLLRFRVFWCQLQMWKHWIYSINILNSTFSTKNHHFNKWNNHLKQRTNKLFYFYLRTLKIYIISKSCFFFSFRLQVRTHFLSFHTFLWTWKIGKGSNESLKWCKLGSSDRINNILVKCVKK